MLHIKIRKPFQNAKRKNESLYRTCEWRQLRKETIEKNPCCYYCGSVDNLQVHHITPPKGNRDLFFDTDNLMVVCRYCHSRLTGIENAKHSIDTGGGR